MPSLPPVSIPRDAFEKATAKSENTDFYEELTDEERDEEDLPPRPGKSEAKPETEESAPEPAKAEPEQESEDGQEVDETEGEPGDDDAGDAAEELVEQIAQMREDLNAALGKPEPAKKANEDPLLEAALDHDDPVVQGLAERLKKAEDRLAEHEVAARDERIARQQRRDDREFRAVQKSYTIDGKPITEAHRDAIDDFVVKHPEAGRNLSIEQLTRVVFPNAVRSSAPPKAPKKGTNAEGGPVATIIDSGSAGAAPEGGKWKPRPNESIESAISEAGKRLFRIDR